MSDQPQASRFLIYQAEDGAIKIEVRFEEETVWLSQPLMAELFGTTQQNVSLHLQNIYEEGELQPAATHKEYLLVRREGARDVQRRVLFYNLDAIISMGYRVKSRVVTQFRIWATQRLREYIVKGFVLDDERLKNPDLPFDYFDELLRRIQDIRTSERRFYQKITDVYATSIDYDPTDEASLVFFKTVQNKMHWAIAGQTAAQIVHARADSAKPNMGLTSWRGPKVRKQDVAIAKLDGFMRLNDRDILSHAGTISHDLALHHAETQYDAFRQQRLNDEAGRPDDFERSLQRLPKPSAKVRGKKGEA